MVALDFVVSFVFESFPAVCTNMPRPRRVRGYTHQSSAQVEPKGMSKP